MLNRKISLICYFRSFLLGAAFTPQGMQSLGAIHALEPALRELYPDPDALKRARQRYIRHFNTHPFCAPFLLGIFLNLEQLIAKGMLPEDCLGNIKETAEYTLSAIGDSVFSGTLIPFWALASACLLALNLPIAALLLTLALFLFLQIFRVVSFYFGLQHGLQALESLRKLKIINWGERLKYCNAVLLAAFLIICAKLSHAYIAWAGFCISLPLIGYFLVVRTNTPRAIPLCIIVLAYWLIAL